MSYFNKFLISPIAFIAMNVTLSQQAHAWQHLEGSYNVCNTFGDKITVFKTHSYQMDTNNSHSASQVIQPGACAAIDFWAQYQANGYDIDDAMDFQVNDKNNKNIGKFTIKVIHWEPGTLMVGVINYPGFVHVKQTGTVTAPGWNRQTTGEMSIGEY